MGLKPTIRNSLLGCCAFLLLASACATSSKTGKPGLARAKKKAAAAKTAAAESSSDDKNKAKPPAPAPAKAPKAAAVAEKKKPPAPPPPPPEPEIPSKLPEPLYCPTPSEVQPGTDLTIRCAAKPASGTRKVVLHYRPSGTERFITADATRSHRGWYVVNIKGSEVKGSSLQFFAQAHNANNKVTASNGTDESPNILLIRKGSSGAAGPGGTDQPVADEDPLAHIQRERDAESGLSNEGRRRPARKVWLAMGLGSGYGWFPTRAPELNTGAKVTGMASGGILHLLPEIGYQWTDRIAFSLQGRYQFVLTDTGTGNTGGGQPKSWAWAVLGRVHLFSDRLFGSASNLQLFATGNLGVGTAFRLYVAPNPSNNPSANFVTSDTVNGGPVAAGVGGGVVYHLNNRLALAAELRALAGFWNVATVFEAGLSAQVDLWSVGARSAAAAEPASELPPEPEYTPPE
ncbi:MAG TPA: hypothetical protein VJ801_06685 [Polyangia bacterium]|nr:hypothetical protein [Polyangia bacterium]